MGGMQFDRQLFAEPKDPPPRSSSSPVNVLLLLAVVALVAVGGFVFYGFLQQGEGLRLSRSPEAAEIVEKLEGIEARLEQLESRRTERNRRTSGASTNRKSGKTKAASAATAPRTVSRVSAATKPQTTSSSSSTPLQDASLANRSKGPISPQGQVPADAERWKAATDRLGTVVGELGSQRSEISRNREELTLLMDRFQGTDVAFALQKKMGRQRVGPVSLRLERSDPKNQRYAMRLLADDKAVLLKDRALNEAVRFYIQGLTEPLELVVSEIGKNQVAGKLVLPKTETTR